MEDIPMVITARYWDRRQGKEERDMFTCDPHLTSAFRLLLDKMIVGHENETLVIETTAWNDATSIVENARFFTDLFSDIAVHHDGNGWIFDAETGGYVPRCRQVIKTAIHHRVCDAYEIFAREFLLLASEDGDYSEVAKTIYRKIMSALLALRDFDVQTEEAYLTHFTEDDFEEWILKKAKGFPVRSDNGEPKWLTPTGVTERVLAMSGWVSPVTYDPACLSTNFASLVDMNVPTLSFEDVLWIWFHSDVQEIHKFRETMRMMLFEKNTMIVHIHRCTNRNAERLTKLIRGLFESEGRPAFGRRAHFVARRISAEDIKSGTCLVTRSSTIPKIKDLCVRTIRISSTRIDRPFPIKMLNELFSEKNFDSFERSFLAWISKA